jgi:hypothetical protein
VKVKNSHQVKLLRTKVAEAYVRLIAHKPQAVEEYNAALNAHREYYHSLPLADQREEYVRLTAAKIKALGIKISKADLETIRGVAAKIITPLAKLSSLSETKVSHS